MTVPSPPLNDNGAWQLEDNRATLRDHPFNAQVLLETPQAGLCDFQGPASRNSGSLDTSGSPTNIRPLCIALPGEPDLKAALSDAYVRREDLVAVYEESPARPFRTQVYWHAIPTSMKGQLHGGVEVVVSIDTSQLDMTSECSIHTDFPAGELLRLRDTDACRFDTVPAESNEAVTFRKEEGPGVFLFRPPNADWSYAEVVHATDFSEAQLSRAAADRPRRLTYNLFHRWMEKGVIVRSRMRGVFLSRQDDEAAAVGCFEDLRHAKLPLTA